ncbi:hypothetical protein EYF80_035867 [Liparis tanakae]|uniref:Uncharacterized protein n=1 Tax=Liparis tanakae TaxID=230148 RepID=A0A4Z2GKZ5_9TELE|nr:hypothetical protein EYF80_035867 [Liparis tanakae]
MFVRSGMREVVVAGHMREAGPDGQIPARTLMGSSVGRRQRSVLWGVGNTEKPPLTARFPAAQLSEALSFRPRGEGSAGQRVGGSAGRAAAGWRTGQDGGTGYKGISLYGHALDWHGPAVLSCVASYQWGQRSHQRPGGPFEEQELMRLHWEATYWFNGATNTPKSPSQPSQSSNSTERNRRLGKDANTALAKSDQLEFLQTSAVRAEGEMSKARCHMAKDCEPTVGSLGGDGYLPVNTQGCNTNQDM